MKKDAKKKKFVAVIVDGKLNEWRGPNPDQDPMAKRLALAKSASFTNKGHTAYPVVIEEAQGPGRPRIDDRPRKVVGTYIREDSLEILKEKMKNEGKTTSISAEISAIVENAIRRYANGIK